MATKKKREKVVVEEVVPASAVLNNDLRFDKPVPVTVDSTENIQYQLIRVRPSGIVRREIIFTGSQKDCIVQKIKFERENPRFSSRTYLLKIMPVRG